MRKSALMTVAALAAINLWAIPGKMTTSDGTLLQGDIKWQARTKQYVVSVKKGKTVLDQERKLEDVKSLDIAKPEGLDKAIEQVQAGQGSAAIPVLAKIAKDYEMLQWDKTALRYLAQAYIAAGDAQKAYDACQAVVAVDKKAAYTGELAPAYWQTLLKLGKKDVLEKLLNKAASTGDRATSAAALNMRGDIIVAGSNDNQDQLKQALTDGYLRVILMYPDAECAGQRQEALLKAAQIFDKLGQGARAEKLRQQAKAL